MKKFVFVLAILAVVFCFVSEGYAQQAPFASPEEAFRGINLKEVAISRSNRRTEKMDRLPRNLKSVKLDANSVPVQSGGAGQFPLFQVHADREFAERNQDVSFTLQSQFNFPQRIWTYGLILEPGPSGMYDENGDIKYFTPAVGQFGQINGVRSFDTYEDAFVAEMNSSSRSGEYLVMFLFYDEFGNLLQQTMTYFYMRHTGPYGRSLSYIDSARFEGTKGGRSVVIQGHFPPYMPLYVMLGSPGSYQLNYLAYSPDGRTITINIDDWTPWRTIQWDVTILEQNIYRQTMTKVGLLTLNHDRP